MISRVATLGLAAATLTLAACQPVSRDALAHTQGRQVQTDSSFQTGHYAYRLDDTGRATQDQLTARMTLSDDQAVRLDALMLESPSLTRNFPEIRLPEVRVQRPWFEEMMMPQLVQAAAAMATFAETQTVQLPDGSTQTIAEFLNARGGMLSIDWRGQLFRWIITRARETPDRAEITNGQGNLEASGSGPRD